MSRPGRRGLRLAAAALAIVVSAVAAPVAAAEVCTQPSVLQVDDLRAGMKGTALTVVQGYSPSTFNVEILGVLPDGIAPGIDFILVKTSGHVIEETGGIAAGMSGSPVYVNGKLVGAIAYGFSAADQTIGGVTPIQPMLDVINYPLLAAASTAPRQARSVKLSAGLERTAARAAGVSTAEFPSTAKQLLVPVGVSGLNGRAMDKLTERVNKDGRRFAPYRAASAQAVDDPAEGSLTEGSAVGAAASYGDLTFAGVGTLTATLACGTEQRSVAFGHPFFFDGETSLGWNRAEVITVIPDPSNLFGPFKIANLDPELRGTVDQDRLAAIRAVEGDGPALSPVVSHIANSDLGTSRDGKTDIARQDFVSFLAPFHLLLNYDRVFDRIGGGSSDLSWTIRGTRASGTPFELSRRNMYYSPWDISFESIFELESHLFTLQDNPFEDVRIDEVELDSTITQRNRSATIKRVLSASSLQPTFKSRNVLFVRRGDTIKLRVSLLPAGATVARTVAMSVIVPRRFGEGILEVRGGSGSDECAFGCEEFGEGDGGGGSGPATFDELLGLLANADHTYDLVANLDLNGRQRKAVAVQPNIVLGGKRIFVVVR
jgi:hypothetical protein